jgi:hypothetical protein
LHKAAFCGLISFRLNLGVAVPKAWISLVGALAALVSVWTIPPAQAQYDPQDMLATYTAPYARYYAPYALQAAAAYIDVKKLNDTSDPSAHVGLVVEPYRAIAVKKVDIYAKAKEYLRAWRYQFGSTCRRADPDCWLLDNADRRRFEKSGPKFHVWARFPEQYAGACSEVSIAFRGSTLAARDWISNFNPVTRFAFDDHYQRLQRNIDALIQRITRLPCYQGGTRIVSVGHSLGGGLAQFAALANRAGPTRIDKVFAFDSSPVTGAPMLDQALREGNAAALEIDRVHQIGETLINVRRLLQQYPYDSSSCVRTLRYDVIKPTWSIKLHSMEGLAGGIVEASYSAPPGSFPKDQYPFNRPPSAGCNSRYLGPANDNDDYDRAAPPEPAPGVAMRSSGTRLSAGQGHMAVQYASRDGFEFSPPPEMSAVPVKLDQAAPRVRLATRHRGNRTPVAGR